MTIRDYIKNHSLPIWKKYPDFKPDQTGFGGVITSAVASMLVAREPEDFPRNDQFEIYANKDQTRIVSLNLTSGVFRIVHRDLILMVSDWQPIQMNYEVPPLLGAC